MNIEEFPEDVKKDIEDSSLSILEHIKDDIVVIGGWAVRALVGKKHMRYTLDIDGVCDERNMPGIKKKLKKMGLEARNSEWGIQFHMPYTPNIEIGDNKVLAQAGDVELRIEISGPRIKESQTHHYFEFDVNSYILREIVYHNKPEKVRVNVPPHEHMAAVKLGLPADYKNNFDSAILLQMCDIENVIEVIKSNDDWDEMVLRRLPKLKGRASDADRLENMLLINAGIVIKQYIRTLDQIEKSLKK